MYGGYMAEFYKLSIRRELIDFVEDLGKEANMSYSSKAEVVHDALRVLARDLQEQSNKKRDLTSLKEKAIKAEAGE